MWFIDRETELQHLFHQLQLSDGVPDTFFPMAITPPSPDRARLLSLCFPEEFTDDGVVVYLTGMIDGVVPHDEYRDEMDKMTVSQITDIVQLQPASPFDMFEVSTIEILEETQIVPVLELLEDDSSLFKDTVGPDQFRELKIGSPLSTDEMDRLIHLLRPFDVVFHGWFSGYNQILMAQRIWRRTFITEWGTYCYKVMPFGLKNAGATYQRVATTLFHDMMHRDVEVYVDDMIVKSRGKSRSPRALERFFERIEN
ncbi:hypothetical protein CK203_051219 [Vitis vinifera]|uniref:Reverse transcriptase domain-containing protein n=1 Tax=Vitis vinifera TaxID=29760 RepID=A0A438H889_VITVI|nr:hypothetical protein CK203_051219 [Vitis vinifera]